MNVLVLTRYGSLGASSRLRFLQYFPFLQLSGFQLDAHCLINDVALSQRYSNGSYKNVNTVRIYWGRVKILLRSKRYDFLWIEKEALPWMPYWFEKLLLNDKKYVLDFDDAVFHNYDLASNRWIKFFMSQRVDRLMNKASLVICGNDYLANRAHRAGARRVEILPTAIDLNRYLPNEYKGIQTNGLRKLVWIGSPTTSIYLNALIPALKTLAATVPFCLRVIGAEFHIPGVNIECLAWQEETEVDLIAECDIGLMPLIDSPWERGKCGYKLIQYMACGLAVIASPVGVNTSIVQDGKNGFLAADTESWVRAMAALLTDPQQCQDMGRIGRQQVEEEYCIQVTAPKLANYLRNAIS